MNAQQTFEHAATLGVHFIVQGEAVVAIPAALVTDELNAAINRNSEAIRVAVLTAHSLVTSARRPKEQNT